MAFHCHISPQSTTRGFPFRFTQLVSTLVFWLVNMGSPVFANSSRPTRLDCTRDRAPSAQSYQAYSGAQSSHLRHSCSTIVYVLTFHRLHDLSIVVLLLDSGTSSGANSTESLVGIAPFASAISMTFFLLIYSF